MSHLNAEVVKIFIRPSGLYGSGNVDDSQQLQGTPRMGLSYEAVGMDENGDLVYQPGNDEMGLGFEFMHNGNVFISSTETARTAQVLMTDDAREWFEAPDAEVVYITDNKGWL